MDDPPDYEPDSDKCVAGIASGRGLTPDEVPYDYIVEQNQFLFFPVVNYVEGDHEPIREMLNDPACLLGLSDGGAHCTSIVDSGLPSFMLAHWGRDRHRGPRLPLEHLVKRQTSETADFFGLSDRGRLVPGMRADVNIIDFDRLRLHKPELVHDMPAGGRRFVQPVDGYQATLAAGPVLCCRRRRAKSGTERTLPPRLDSRSLVPARRRARSLLMRQHLFRGAIVVLIVVLAVLAGRPYVDTLLFAATSPRPIAA